MILTFGEAIKKKRVELGLKLEQAASIIGISSTYLCLLEKGERKDASFRIIIRIADSYGISLDELRPYFMGPVRI